MDVSFSDVMEQESSFDDDQSTQILYISENSQQMPHSQRQTLKTFEEQQLPIKQDQQDIMELYYKNYFRNVIEKSGATESQQLYFISLNNMTNAVYCQQIIRDQSITDSIEYILNTKDVYSIDLSRCKRPYLVTPNNVYAISSVEGRRGILYADDIRMLNQCHQQMSVEMKQENAKDIFVTAAHIKGPFFEDVAVDVGMEKLVRFLRQIIRASKINHLVLTQPLFRRPKKPQHQTERQNQEFKHIDFDNPFDVMKFVAAELAKERGCKIYIQCGRDDIFYSTSSFPQTPLGNESGVRMINNPETLQIGTKLITFADFDVQQFKCMTNLAATSGTIKLESPLVSSQSNSPKPEELKSESSQPGSQENVLGTSKVKISTINEKEKDEYLNMNSDTQLIQFVNQNTQTLTTTIENVPQQEQEAFITRYRNFIISCLINNKFTDQIPFLPRDFQQIEHFDNQCQIFSVINDKFPNPIAIINQEEQHSFLLSSGGLFSSNFFTLISCGRESVEAKKIVFQVKDVV